MNNEKLMLVAFLTVNVVGIIFMSILLINLCSAYRSRGMARKLLVVLISLTIVILIFDSLMWILDKKVFPGAYIMNQIVTTIYYILNPAIGLAWLCYVEVIINKNVKSLSKKLWIYIIPFLVSAIISISSPWTHFYFSIDSVTNTYVRTDKFFLLMVFSTYIYIIYAFFIVLFNHKKLEKRIMFTLLFFIVFPLIASILQILIYGLSVIWISVALAIMILFINMQSQSVLKDYLTGLYNRQEIETYTFEVLNKVHRQNIYGIMIDIEKFKSINDTFGHVVGDDALKNVSTILQSSVNKHDFVARYGGDEFIIVVESKDDVKINQIKENIRKNVDLFNEANSAPYTLKLSVGSFYIDSNTEVTVREFISTIDKKMYEDKINRRNIINK